MINILITHSYFYKFDQKQWKFKQPYPPLGTLIAAGLLRNKGYNVNLVDVGLADDTTVIQQALSKCSPDYLVIYDDGFNYLTKMCLTKMREAAIEMAKMAKDQQCKVIVSSSDSTDQFELYLKEGVDFVLIGEAEESLIELIHNLENNIEHRSLKGIAYQENGKISQNPRRPVMTDLDSLPLPAWDLLDITPYKNIWLKAHGYFSMNIATTRGCPYKCNWCAKPIYGNRYNTRSPSNVVEEIDFLLKKFKPDHFWMCDDIFGLKPGWVQEFNKLVKEKSLKFKYKIQSRVDLLLKEDTISALSESGLHTVWVGAESGSQKILTAMDKGTSIKQIEEATYLLKQNNIKVAFFLQFGYLGETKEDIDATINMVKKLMPDEIGISVSYPLPGTKFYEKVKEDLLLKSNWEDSDDLDMMFNSTYSSAYYKKLHRYVHNVYRLRKATLLVKNAFLNPLGFKRKYIKSILSGIYHFPALILNGYFLRRTEAISE